MLKELPENACSEDGCRETLKKENLTLCSVKLFHLLKTISYFPLFVLKGVDHYWTFFSFVPGAYASGRQRNPRRCSGDPLLIHPVEEIKETPLPIDESVARAKHRSHLQNSLARPRTCTFGLSPRGCCGMCLNGASCNSFRKVWTHRCATAFVKDASPFRWRAYSNVDHLVLFSGPSSF